MKTEYGERRTRFPPPGKRNAEIRRLALLRVPAPRGAGAALSPEHTPRGGQRAGGLAELAFSRVQRGEHVVA